MGFIEVQGVSKSFQAKGALRHVLEDVNLTVERGEFVSIVGFMGCGKSTVLNIVAGLTRPDCGRVTIDGESVNGIRPRTAYVFQHGSLLPWLSALENVQLAVEAAFPTLDRPRRRAHSQRYLELVGLGRALHRKPGQLSGGMRQRVAIARALALEPEIMFLDEPFSALDALTRANLQQELAQLCGALDRPVTTIMITNSVDEALLLSDRIVPMTDGPAATMGPWVDVTIARPRTVAQLQHDDQALRVRAHVVTFLTEYLTASRRGAPRAVAPPEPVVAAAPCEGGVPASLLSEGIES